MRSISSRRWIVSQIGARQHYTVPIGFDRLNQLHSFYTDLWCRRGSSLLHRMGGRAKDLAGRFSEAVPPQKVFAFNLRSLRCAMKEHRAETIDEQYQQYIRKGIQFSQAVNRHLLPRLVKPDQLAFFSFNTGCLETLNALRELDIPTVVDQIDPARVEEKILLEETERWPQWQARPGRIPECYFERLQAEWEGADVVFVNSTWCRDALVAQGVPAPKIAVAPIAFPHTSAEVRRRPRCPQEPLRVLWLGQVNLRKGIQYLIQAAKQLLDSNITFRVIGPISISETALASAPPNMQFEGALPRIETSRAYREADLFVLPTLSDGFAITQLEAMAQGLPVVATPNCGDVVTDGHDGLIVPIRDAESLANAFTRLSEDRSLLEGMSDNAYKKSRSFDIDSVAEQRVQAIEEAFNRTVSTCL